MADVLVSVVLEQLKFVILKEAEQEVRLVVGVKEEVKKLTSNLKAIQAVLHDAESRQFTEATVNDWLEKLKDVSYDMDDVLDEWNTEILKSEIEKEEEKAENVPVVLEKKKKKKKVSFFISSPCFCFRQVGLRHDIAVKIKALNESLDAIAIEKNRFHFNNVTLRIEKPERLETTSFLDLLEVRGRVDEKKTVIRKLCENSQEESGLQIISIVGMGGMGKTTLAQLAYNADDVKSHFEKRIWVCVSDPFDEIKIAKTIIESLKGSRSDLDALDALLLCIRESVQGKKFLLVLDDVWIEDDTKWNQLKLPFQFGSSGSRVLVTTRKEISANVMKSTHTIQLGRLSSEDSWSLFSQIAFYGRSNEEYCKELEQLGREIVDKCKGLPLALKILGGHLRLKKRKEQWQNVLDSRLWHSEEIKKGLFAPLLLSFYDLPSTLKRCFSYCALYPKDTIIYVDNLTELWMAQGYLNSEESIEIEIGREYFENLAMRSFFQDFEKSGGDRIVTCKMHDIVHDFAQSLTENECFAMNVDENKELGMKSFYKARHLTLTSSTKQTFEVPSFVYKAKHLRTLISLANKNYKSIILPSDLFRHLTSLRALDLSSLLITEVREDVERLIHLRYLDLSNNFELKELPESICNLCNLQTLNVSCGSLTKLPQGMGKLINLRHLTLDEDGTLIKSFPKGFGRLSSLRKLNLFVVGGNDDSEGCKLGELKDLNQLREHLQIEGLGNLIEVCEVEHAQLKKKIHLSSLNLVFNGEGEENKKMENDEVFLNALELHPDLEELVIREYHGTAIFSNWLMSIKLKKLILRDCNKLECLPPLGRLPFLEELTLQDLKSVKKVGVEFLGIETKGETLPSSSSSLEFFPNLKFLHFWGLEEWEEWDGIGGMREEEKDFGVTIMPCLFELIIWSCPKLKALPHFFLQKTPLNKLIFSECPILKQRYKKETGEDWSKISHIPNIKIDGKHVQGDGESTRELNKRFVCSHRPTLGSVSCYTSHLTLHSIRSTSSREFLVGH